MKRLFTCWMRKSARCPAASRCGTSTRAGSCSPSARSISSTASGMTRGSCPGPRGGEYDSSVCAHSSARAST